MTRAVRIVKSKAQIACVCACVRERDSVCVFAFVCVGACVCERERACVFACACEMFWAVDIVVQYTGREKGV
jgi:hypothetical protein